MRIGRYKLLFNPHRLFWFQTYKPTVMREWWWFLLLEEVDVRRCSAKPQYKPGTEASCVGRKYMYCKLEKAPEVESDV